MNTKLLDVYFAGLIDGEGYVGIQPRPPVGHLRPRVKVSMCCQKTIQTLADHFGGTCRPSKVRPGCSPIWSWEVAYHKAIIVLQRVRPYLITKAEITDYILGVYKPKYRRKKKRTPC